MSRIVRSIIVAVVISGFSIIEPNYLNLLNSSVYASEDTSYLKSIYLSEGDNIEFKKDVHSYIVDVDKDTEEAFIKVKPADSSHLVTINGEFITKGDKYKKMLSLNKGKNKIEIEVKDSKTNSTSKYTVYVYRGGKEAVYLKDININNNTIGFNNSSKSYNIELDEGTHIVELETIPEEGNYSITVNGRELGETNSIKLKFKIISNYIIKIGLKDNDTGREGVYTLNIYLGIPVTPNVSDAINAVLKPNQWVVINGRWRYNDSFANPLKDTWFYDNKYSSYFHFNSMGNMQTGWINDCGNWYYLKQNGEMQTGWLNYENQWYFLDNNGVMRTDWVEYNDKWYFLRKNGTAVTGWIISKDRSYFLNSSGVMETGWLYYKKKWYFFNSNGAMETGWIQSNEDWYFLNDDGSMKSREWLYYDGNWYCLNYDGNMIYDNINIKYSGWLHTEEDNKYYYFNEDGTMRTITKTMDGYTYNFNEDGSANFG